jgi:hypothetical protein
MYSSFLELYIPSFQKRDSIEEKNMKKEKRRKDNGTKED